MKFVLDASVALAWFLPDESAEGRAYAHRVLEISRSALALLRRLPVETHVDIYAVEILIERALRYHLQAYDAVYFDLAHALRLPIATLDAGLRTAARAHGVRLFEPAAA